MKPGTPGFQGVRLIEAREARGLSGVALADMIGVSRPTITHYEKGTQTPRPEVMERIAQVLNLPMAFFLSEPETETSGVFYYRSLAAATKTQRKRAQRRHAWLRYTVSWLNTLVEFPEISFPDLRAPADPNMLDAQYVERAAMIARRHWSMADGPILDVPRFLENQGAIVSFSDFGSEVLDAFSECGRSGFEPYVSVSADKKVAARSNLTAAHELGHIVLHRNVPGNVANRAAEHKLMEDQAFRFADAFLLPAVTFAPQVRHPSLDLFRALKGRWRVSIGAMIMRARDLNLTNEDQHRRLWIAYTKRGWKHGEPLDDELSENRPRILRDTFDLILGERVASKESIRAALPYAPSDIESLCGLEDGYLADGYGERVVRLPTRNVVQFNREREYGPDG